ncbi:MAG: 30S ribosomal protein S21 [Flavobacteriales bacterium]|nr:30S ribosomal protein S21 [Flavobacteriales bacterium]|tara:strand:- start:87 stop:281 length:195 start_codon:yes stop_codon:yes gene_type:complete
MIIIPVKDGESIDRALKRFKRKFDKVGTLREIRSRKNFVKKSTQRREELMKAKFSQSFLNSQED